MKTPVAAGRFPFSVGRTRGSDVTYRTQAYSELFGFAVDLDSDRKLADAIINKSIIDFCEVWPKSGATIIAHMRFPADGTTLFEGLTGNQTFRAGESIERIIAHWNGFVQNQQNQHEMDKSHDSRTASQPRNPAD